MLNGSQLDKSRKSIEGLKVLEQSLQGTTTTQKNPFVQDGLLILLWVVFNQAYVQTT